MAAESVESAQSSAASAIPSTAAAPQPAHTAKVTRPDQALSATGASAPPGAAASAVAASLRSAAARGQPPAIAAAPVPQPVGTIKVTRPDLATASSAPARGPLLLDSRGSLFGLADSPPTLVSYQRGSPSPTQPAGSTLVASPNQARAPSSSAAAVSVPTVEAASDVSSPDADSSPAANTALLSLPDAFAASVVRSPEELARDFVSVPGLRMSFKCAVSRAHVAHSVTCRPLHRRGLCWSLAQALPRGSRRLLPSLPLQRHPSLQWQPTSLPQPTRPSLTPSLQQPHTSLHQQIRLRLQPRSLQHPTSLRSQVLAGECITPCLTETRPGSVSTAALTGWPHSSCYANRHP